MSTFTRILSIVMLMGAFTAFGAVAQATTTVSTMDNPDLGTHFTDPDGMTLYIFLKDTPDSGKSTCYDQCEQNWPVFSATEPLSLPDSVPGELGTITRDDGTTQVTYNGWPLYFWAADQNPGDVTGQGVGDVWFAAIPAEGDAIPGAEAPQASPAASPMAQGGTTVITAENSDLGTILTDAQGMTLYIFLSDTPGSGESTCYDKCEQNWPVFSAEEPLTLPDGVSGELGTIERTDGTMQVTYNGWPLYFFAKDQQPGDVTGQGIGDVWYVAIPAEGDAIPGAEAPQASPMASTGANRVEVTLSEFTIDMPTELSAGMTEFVITNDGGATHGFEIEGNGIEMELENHLQGGQQGTLMVDLKPGTYEIYCPVGNHADQGMELNLTVTD